MTDPPLPDGSEPYTRSPDVRVGNGFVRLLRTSWKERSQRPLYRYIFVPAHTPTGFAAESLGDVHKKLKTSDVEIARATLDEAEATAKEPLDRIDSAERRATTLQGTVAIAASVSTAGASFVLDSSKVPNDDWRTAFGIIFALFVFCLVGSALRALGATSRIFGHLDPGLERIVDRSQMTESDALTHRAAELLRSADVADMIARTKVGLLRSAAWWFRAAILALAVLVTLIAVYVIADPRATSIAAPTTPVVSKQ